MFKKITWIFIVCLNFTSTSVFASSFYPKDHIVIDLSRNIEWLRCSVGQQWTGETCTGNTILMDHATIKEAIKIADEQLGPSWRLPNLDELYSLVCKRCKTGEKFNTVNNVAISSKLFPNTDPRAYWTGERNSITKGSYWTVNFFTGHKFGRFFPEQDMAVRLVRDR